MCSYCPQSTITKKYQGERVMTPETFSRILANVDRRTTKIYFTGFTEHFLVDGAEDMMIEAYKAGFAITLYSTLVGFTAEKCRKLKESGIHFRVVHFHEFDGVGFDRNEFEKNMALFRDNISSDIYRRARVTAPVSRGGNAFASPGYRKGWLTCPRFEGNVVLPNGKLYLCCSDWGLKHCLGDLLTSHFDSIEIKKARGQIRLLALSEDSDLLCRSCEWAIPVEKPTGEEPG